MTSSTTPVTSILPPASLDRLRLAMAGYLARFQGQSRRHTELDLRCYLRWCLEQGFDPLAATRAHIELFLRWRQEQRHYADATVSRRLSVLAGFYRTCVIDGLLAASAAEYVRRPTVPAQSTTLGLTHLQFEAMLAAARDSVGEEHGHRVLRVVGKGHKIVLAPMPPAVARAVDRAVDGADLRANPA